MRIVPPAVLSQTQKQTLCTGSKATRRQERSEVPGLAPRNSLTQVIMPVDGLMLMMATECLEMVATNRRLPSRWIQLAPDRDVPGLGPLNCCTKTGAALLDVSND